MNVFRESRVSPAAHRLYRELIDGFLATSNVPDGGDRNLLRELAGEDWLALDDAGRVSVLYPFSLSSSGIDVTVNGVERQAMCAIDALGVAAMLNAEVRIEATCPVSGEYLDIGVDGSVSSNPPGVVVLRRRQGGSAHLSRCAATRFFRSATDAEAWRAGSGADGDVVLSLADAYREASDVFGRAYSDGVRMVI